MTAQYNKTQKGFTLIELLVTIAIIAIISVVAVALFGNIQANARDAKRRSELESIANVLEVNKVPQGATAGYQPAACSLFGGGICPGQTTTTATIAVDPSGYPYCISTTAGVGDITVANMTNTGTVTCGTGWTVLGNGVPTAGSAVYKICTRLENGSSAQPFCRTNTQ